MYPAGAQRRERNLMALKQWKMWDASTRISDADLNTVSVLDPWTSVVMNPSIY